MGGLGGGKTGSNVSTPNTELLAQTSAEEIKLGRPIRAEAQKQGLEALQKGAVPDVGIPAVQNAIQNALAAISRAKVATTESLARTGLSRTPFGTRIQAQQEQEGLAYLSGIPVIGAKEFADTGLKTATTGLQVGVSGLSNAAQNETQLRASTIRSATDTLVATLSAIGQAAGGVGYGYGAGMGAKPTP